MDALQLFLGNIWFVLIGLMLVLYVVLDGFDLGVGILSLFACDEDRRGVMMASLGSVWDANETWLVIAGGTLFGAFPMVYGTALAAFLGHLYPVFFGFQGGKGVATALGVIYGLYWPVGLLTTAVWLVMALVFRISSLAALTAILVMPAGFYWLQPQTPVIVAMGILTALLFWRHRSNIANLVNGTEGRISFGKK